MNLDHILNWQLKPGSHPFPGPEGGTCINEAAIVAMGFEYKSVSTANDCPPCFSRPIAAFAIHLNDRMPDGLRNELLMPFVTRLGGTADTPAVERRREEYIIVQICKRMFPLSLGPLGYPELAELCAKAETLADVREAARQIALARALDLALARARARARAEVFRVGVQILDEAIRLGREGDPLEMELVQQRMNRIREVQAA